MHDRIVENLESTRDDDDVTDVTDQYEDLVEQVIEISGARSNPLPPDHVMVLEEEGEEYPVVRFMTVVGDELYGFEVANQTGDAYEDSDMFVETLARLLRAMEETIWNDVVLDGDWE